MIKSSRKSLAKKAQKKIGPGCLRLFFLPFFLVGVGLFYGLTIRPAMQLLAARDWLQTPCVIDSSEVVSHSGDSTTYSVKIGYHYTFDDRPFASQRYNFSTGSSSSGRKSKQALVKAYPPGMETVCFVNPKAPQEAVLNREWHQELAFGGIGVVFALAGGLGIIFAGRLTGSHDLIATPQQTGFNTGAPVLLKPKYTPFAKFVGMLIGAIAWNGFISIFIYLVFVAEHSKAPLFAKVIIGILALVGVGLIVGVCTRFLALFNPRIRLTAQSTTVPLGGELHFTWTISGRPGMLRKLRIVFEGREEATYKRGTSTATDTQVFAEIPVFESTEREFLSQGSARVVVPANLMHTFEASHNKVLWRLKVQGEIPRWPDVADEYPIVVLPLPLRH